MTSVRAEASPTRAGGVSMAAGAGVGAIGTSEDTTVVDGAGGGTSSCHLGWTGVAI